MADVLKDELTSDPLGRGYAGMSDEEAAADLNISNRPRGRTSMSGDEIFQATNPGEFVALSTGSGNTADDQGHWLAFCGRAEIDPFATANVQFVVAIFGSGSTTVASLNTLRVESITRAVELPGVIAPVKVGHVAVARGT